MRQKVLILFVLAAVVTLVCVSGLTRAQEVAKQDAPKSRGEKTEKADPLELTAEEKALIQPSLGDFQRWSPMVESALKEMRSKESALTMRPAHET